MTDVGRIDDAQRPGAAAGVVPAVVKGWVAGQQRLGLVRLQSVRVGLVVGRLGLHVAEVDVGGAMQQILIHLRMFTSRAVEPRGALGLDQEPTSGVDGHLRIGADWDSVATLGRVGVLRAVEVVIGHPQPHVVEVARRPLGHVHKNEGRHASLLDSLSSRRTVS